jgi:hypothetical protein
VSAIFSLPSLNDERETLMKRAFALWAALSIPLAAFATPPGSRPAPTAAEQPTETVEVITIAAGTLSGLLNITMTAEGKPSYLAGAVGIGLGAAALGLTAVENPAHEKGLVAGGAFAIATGLVATWYRHELNRRAAQARLAPTWRGGSPGVALVVDF